MGGGKKTEKPAWPIRMVKTKYFKDEGDERPYVEPEWRGYGKAPNLKTVWERGWSLTKPKNEFRMVGSKYQKEIKQVIFAAQNPRKGKGPRRNLNLTRVGPDILMTAVVLKALPQKDSYFKYDYRRKNKEA